MFPPRDGTLFFRIVTGALKTRGENAFALEYFYNGEGYSDEGTALGSPGSTASWAASTNPRAAPRAAAAGPRRPTPAARPSRTPEASGLRRHYLHASWTRGGATSVWTGAVRTVFGLDDGAFALTPGVGWAPRGNVTLNLDAVLLLGPDESEYRLSPVRGALQARLKVLF